MSLLSAHALATGYPERVLVRELELRIEPGQTWAVLGNNGSGKSTLLLTLAGLRPALRGEIQLSGRVLSAFAARARARHLGLLLQEDPCAFWGSVREYVLLGRYPHRRSLWGWSDGDFAQADAAIAQVDLDGRAQRPLNALSGGERQRARLAMMLAQSPHVLLLDEPLQHLDLRHQRDVLALLGKWADSSARAVCMSLHDPWAARRFCTHAVMLFDDGRWRAGPVEALLDDASLERLYGFPLSGWLGAAQGAPGRHV
jgi:iron complex transport system ATP-binding protein